jgi:hypothetical protein
MDHKGLRALLVVHGFITAAAGLVLTIAPRLIPSVVGIYLEPNAYVLAAALRMLARSGWSYGPA